MASRIRTSEPHVSTNALETGREPIPHKLAEKLLAFSPKLGPLPTSDETIKVLKLREQLEYLHKKVRQDLNRQRVGNTSQYSELKDRDTVVTSVLKHILKWVATEREARELKQMDEKAGQLELRAGIDSDVFQIKWDGSDRLLHDTNLNKLRKSTGIRVLVKLFYYSRAKDREVLETTTKITCHALHEKTPIVTILQFLGATNPKIDFLDFTLPKESDFRDSRGLPINIPPQLRKIGWPGSKFTDGNKIELGHIFKYVRNLHSEDKEPTLRCNFKRVKQDVYDPTLIKPAYISGGMINGDSPTPQPVVLKKRSAPQNNNYGVWEEDERGANIPEQDVPRHETGLRCVAFQYEPNTTGDPNVAYMHAVLNKCSHFIRAQQKSYQTLDGVRDLVEILVCEINQYDAKMVRVHNNSVHRWVLHQSDELRTGDMEDPNRPSEVPYEEYIPEDPAPPIDRALSWKDPIEKSDVEHPTKSVASQADGLSTPHKGGNLIEANRFDIPAAVVVKPPVSHPKLASELSSWHGRSTIEEAHAPRTSKFDLLTSQAEKKNIAKTGAETKKPKHMNSTTQCVEKKGIDKSQTLPKLTVQPVQTTNVSLKKALWRRMKIVDGKRIFVEETPIEDHKPVASPDMMMKSPKVSNEQQNSNSSIPVIVDASIPIEEPKESPKVEDNNVPIDGHNDDEKQNVEITITTPTDTAVKDITGSLPQDHEVKSVEANITTKQSIHGSSTSIQQAIDYKDESDRDLSSESTKALSQKSDLDANENDANTGIDQSTQLETSDRDVLTFKVEPQDLEEANPSPSDEHSTLDSSNNKESETTIVDGQDLTTDDEDLDDDSVLNFVM